jgi:hypothetical protein
LRALASRSIFGSTKSNKEAPSLLTIADVRLQIEDLLGLPGHSIFNLQFSIFNHQPYRL